MLKKQVFIQSFFSQRVKTRLVATGVMSVRLRTRALNVTIELFKRALI